MAKLGLLFIAVFCIVQISLAVPVPEEPQANDFLKTVQESLAKTFNQENLEKVTKEGQDNLNKGLEAANNFVKTTFTKENADNLAKQASEQFGQLSATLKQLGEQAQTRGSELLANAQKGIHDLTAEKKN